MREKKFTFRLAAVTALALTGMLLSVPPASATTEVSPAGDIWSADVLPGASTTSATVQVAGEVSEDDSAGTRLQLSYTPPGASAGTLVTTGFVTAGRFVYELTFPSLAAVPNSISVFALNSPCTEGIDHFMGIVAMNKSAAADPVLPLDAPPMTYATPPACASSGGSDSGNAPIAGTVPGDPAFKTKTTQRFLDASIRKSEHATVKVKVARTSSAQPWPTGRVTIKRGTKVLRTVALKSSKHGVIKVKLPRMKRGTKHLRAYFTPNTKTQKASHSGLRTLRIR